MARSEHHSAHAFLLYFFIHVLWQGPRVSGWIVFLVLFFGFFPDIDGIYWRLKEKKRWEQNFNTISIIGPIGLYLTLLLLLLS